jgi:guanine deaminase
MKEKKTAEYFMDEAFGEAFQGMRSNHGGPFGAVIVRNGEIIGRGCNRVILHSDPTAHAEIVAIRDACANIQSHDLSGCVIYTTCEPCPMCFSAIYWSNLSEVIFCLSRQDAEDLGFRDKHIYEEINRDFPDRNTKFTRMDHPMINPLIREWNGKSDRFLY